MKIELRAVDDSNRAEVESLKVADDQQPYIASNQESLNTSLDEAHKEVARPFAIYGDDRLVGFTMFAFDMASRDPDDRYWLWRFMIDKSFQRNGYGTAALEAIIAYFKSHGATHILLSTKESNTAALSLYHKYGFAETGEMNGEEIVLRLEL